MKEIPEVGKFYHFFDDGKISPNRHYICKCERIITPEESKKIMVEVPNKYMDGVKDSVSLYEHWYNNEVPNYYWLIADETDYFIECSCPKYDDNNLWFVMSVDGGWFSMDIQNFWQGGRLDVDGEIFQRILNDIKEHPDWYHKDIINLYNEEKYDK